MAIYRADLHAHSLNGSSSHFPYNSSPKQMVEAAKKKEISIFALSEKEKPIEAYRMIKNLCEEYGMVTFPVQEVTSRDGDMLGIDITEVIKNPKKLSCYEAADEIIA
ncbi:MAG: hypothetical protein V1818_00505 [Candidatus Aenigmatarchaeota archaeon]